MATNKTDALVQGGQDHTPDRGVALGGLGGAVVGGAAGSSAGPVGTVLGIVAGGLIGAGVSEVVEHSGDRRAKNDTLHNVDENKARDPIGPLDDSLANR